MKRTRFNLLAILGMATAITFSACSNDDENVNEPDDQQTERGSANVAMTDAAVDAENVTGVYMSVKGIKADGVDNANDATVMFDATQEVNVMAYQNGETYNFQSLDLKAGSYSGISFILDESKPAYVTFKDNTESEIEIEGNSSASNEYQVMGDFEINADAQTDLVADIDLRKAFKNTSETSAEGEYKLRTTARLVKANSAGTIKGSVENYNEMKTKMEEQNKKAKVVVYAYAEGTYEASEQEDADGEAGLKSRFENSVNSAVVAEDGTFTLAFMEDAEYEIVVASFEKSKDAPEEEEYSFSGSLEAKLTADAALNAVLSGLDVQANSSTNVSLYLGLQ
ncbi:DUF4382 domain-containing protein [Marinoscillum furvescens]|uniref:Uncharacterized protein DUF4382 n=1 Tax=Marinoscillum furvescens DSM 4134 TaxID=1122208 RepID=A0A3D9L5G9_MARFU|nr:DUF4382 domain-containing protein [Marinoscillum furvescens]REE00516.1 uncharacterized protein DUF4382 [Marinoscillum furvescens DSM 4134]